jgi:hypothetical protein
VPPRGGVNDTRRLAGDERLVIDQRQQRRLHQRRLDARRGDAQQRHAGTDDGPLGDGVDVTAEAQPSQVIDEQPAIRPERL